MARKESGIVVTRIKINTPGLETYAQTGRAQKVRIARGPWTILVYNIYAYTNGHTDHEQASKTNRLIQSLREDYETGGKPATMIWGI